MYRGLDMQFLAVSANHCVSSSSSSSSILLDSMIEASKITLPPEVIADQSGSAALQRLAVSLEDQGDSAGAAALQKINDEANLIAVNRPDLGDQVEALFRAIPGPIATGVLLGATLGAASTGSIEGAGSGSVMGAAIGAVASLLNFSLAYGRLEGEIQNMASDMRHEAMIRYLTTKNIGSPKK